MKELQSVPFLRLKVPLKMKGHEYMSCIRMLLLLYGYGTLTNESRT